MQKKKNNWWHLLKQSVIEFKNDDGIKLSASLSFYLIFSIAPLLIIIISIADMFFGHEVVRRELFGQINRVVGSGTTIEVKDMIKSNKLSDHNTLATIIWAVLLFAGASGMFAEIHSTINYIWKIKAKRKDNATDFFKNRLKSVSMLGSAVMLLVVGLIINELVDLLDGRMTTHFPNLNVHFFSVVNALIVFSLITISFAIIFKTMPNKKVPVKGSLLGALLSSVLFMIGKYVIEAYSGSPLASSTYGAAGSIVLLLIWIYYFSIVLYLGAEFAKVHSDHLV
jgi:membrane protein